MAEEGSQFDIAAEKAKVDLEAIMAKMTPEERKGVTTLATWWKANFMNAGHKRLGRIVANLK